MYWTAATKMWLILLVQVSFLQFDLNHSSRYLCAGNNFKLFLSTSFFHCELLFVFNIFDMRDITLEQCIWHFYFSILVIYYLVLSYTMAFLLDGWAQKSFVVLFIFVKICYEIAEKIKSFFDVECSYEGRHFLKI